MSVCECESRASGVLRAECCAHLAGGVSARTASLGLRTSVFEGCPLGLQHPWVDADPGQFCSRALQESGAGVWGETGGNPDTGVLARKLGKQKADEWDSCVNQLQRRGADPRLEWGMLNLQSRI